MISERGSRWHHKLADEAGYALMIRASVLALCLLWTYQAYILGWSDQLVGTVAGSSAWSQRDAYAAQGWSSLAHLSVVNIAKAVMVVPLLVLLIWGMFFPRSIFRLGLEVRIGALAAFGALFIFSYLAGDVPFNFYGSRYYLPVVLPLAVLTFGAIISSWPRTRYLAVTAGIVVVSVYHTYGLVAEPAYQGELPHLSSLADRASGSDLVFLIGNPTLARSHRLAIHSLSKAPVIFIDLSRIGDLELSPMINSYMEALDAEQVTVIADRRLPGLGSQERFQLDSSLIPFGISYATYSRHRVTANLYVSAYRDESTIVRFEAPQWILGGTLRLPLLGGMRNADSHVMVESGGGWLWAMNKSGVAPTISVTSNGVELVLVRQMGSDFVFALPAGSQYSTMIEIQTNTFVPAEVGINTDPRKLGMDVKSIRILAAD